jgi:hypothetical protein
MRFRQTKNSIVPHHARFLAKLQPIPGRAYEYFKGVTPIKTGNAKRNTNFEKRTNGGTIRGDYPYANRLNEGYSKQAKRGMTEPTIREIRRMVRRVL